MRVLILLLLLLGACSEPTKPAVQPEIAPPEPVDVKPWIPQVDTVSLV